MKTNLVGTICTLIGIECEIVAVDCVSFSYLDTREREERFQNKQSIKYMLLIKEIDSGNLSQCEINEVKLK